MKRRATAAILIALIAACGGSEPAMTEEEAIAQVEHHIHDAATQLHPPPRLEPLRPLDIPCVDRYDQATGQFRVERDYWLRDIPTEDNQDIFNTLHHYWTTQNYEIKHDIREEPNARFLEAQHEGFSISVQESTNGMLRLVAQSPCVWTAESPDQR
ncbi:hypothetical protein [Phytoactinopolyspora limicola]|uniref:hypothetical protein n=1 Tax=Phytoactinopolyspora limicola TaxID=2715536 RepID=UPI00140A5957|nr:hypothetical protein [Phytoactinopolyspora limicola]